MKNSESFVVWLEKKKASRRKDVSSNAKWRLFFAQIGVFVAFVRVRVVLGILGWQRRVVRVRPWFAGGNRGKRRESNGLQAIVPVLFVALDRSPGEICPSRNFGANPDFDDFARTIFVERGSFLDSEIGNLFGSQDTSLALDDWKNRLAPDVSRRRTKISGTRTIGTLAFRNLLLFGRSCVAGIVVGSRLWLQIGFLGGHAMVSVSNTLPATSLLALDPLRPGKTLQTADLPSRAGKIARNRGRCVRRQVRRVLRTNVIGISRASTSMQTRISRRVHRFLVGGQTRLSCLQKRLVKTLQTR